MKPGWMCIGIASTCRPSPSQSPTSSAARPIAATVVAGRPGFTNAQAGRTGSRPEWIIHMLWQRLLRRPASESCRVYALRRSITSRAVSENGLSTLMESCSRFASSAARQGGRIATPPLLGRTAALLLATGLLLGTSNVTGKAITDTRMIEGKWRGQIKLAGAPYEIFYLTVNRDGSIVASWGATTEWGTVTLAGGRATFTLSHRTSGDLYYYEEKRERVITIKPRFEGWDARVRPLK